MSQNIRFSKRNPKLPARYGNSVVNLAGRKTSMNDTNSGKNKSVVQVEDKEGYLEIASGCSGECREETDCLGDVHKTSDTVSNSNTDHTASSVGKPLVMDTMTANMCHYGNGRFDYARVLVEIEASKELKKEVTIQYKGSDGSIKGHKIVRIEYSWEPPKCTFCSVFGHEVQKCGKRPRSEAEIAEASMVKESDVNAKKDQEAEGLLKRIIGTSLKKEGGKSDAGIGKQNENMGGKKQNKEVQGGDKAKLNGNPFSVLAEGIYEEMQEINLLKDRMIVDKYLDKKLMPTDSEMSNWSIDMGKYFKTQWDIDRKKEMEDAKIGMEEIEEDVMVDASIYEQVLTANEIEGVELGKNDLAPHKILKKAIRIVFVLGFLSLLFDLSDSRVFVCLGFKRETTTRVVLFVAAVKTKSHHKGGVVFGSTTTPKRSRLYLGLGRDGLLPAIFARVYPTRHTPIQSYIGVGFIACVLSRLLYVPLLSHVISVGSLVHMDPLGFSCPWVPIVSALCILVNIFLLDQG
ncbi:amino acid/polyamine transporter I, Cationic amino acid transporter [Artemisia annua]|uniref:Amino acid/polyamine transporter I, Cationic amino acid transporter n=1 Tax=Artemisia annua TaxID=35608 RepID=A0A2U1PNY1_ARTAN|nr:amino acid/polyamine transporter I, Cationic amino acid transporter [Artemisia annua]